MIKNIFKNKNDKGYTIIETMISISLFIIVVMAGVGSLLNANVVHNKARNVRSIMDNLSFIMEDMSRNMRTGYNYRCYDNANPWTGNEANTPAIETPRSCASGHAIAFEEEINGHQGTFDDQWVYKITGAPLTISKSVDGGQTFIPLHGSEIEINSTPSFSVLGAEPPSAPYSDHQQPLAIIKLSGNIVYKGIDTPFSLQTMVSQRLIDTFVPPAP